MRDLIKHDALLWLVVFQQLRWRISILADQWFAPSAVRFRTALLLLCFWIVGIHASGIFYSTIPVDVVRLKSYVNCLFGPARVVIRVTINKLYFVPEWLVSCVVGMLTGDPRFMVNLTLRHCTPSHGLDQTGCSAGIVPPSWKPGRLPLT